MNINQKGFANIVMVIVIVVILVGAVGYFAFVKKTEPVAQQTTPTPTQTNPVSSTQPAGWKTYTSSQYGFEVKYPSGYSLKENNSGISIQSSQSCEKILGTGGGQWPKDCFIYDLLIQKNKIEGGSTHIPSIKIAGYSSEKFELDGGMWDGSSQTYIQFTKGNQWYISYISFNVENKTMSENLFNQILSTFKFTN